MNDFSFLRNFKIENISHFPSEFIFILIMSFSSGKQKCITNVLYYVKNQRKYLLGKETGNKNVLVSFDYVHTFKNSCKKALTQPRPRPRPQPQPQPQTKKTQTPDPHLTKTNTKTPDPNLTKVLTPRSTTTQTRT